MTTATTERAPISRRWFLKLLMFIVVLLGFGAWGLIDAAWVYPRRQLRFAEFAEFQYLDLAKAAGGLSRAGVSDPAAELTRLESAPRIGELEHARKKWLDALKLVGAAKSENTSIPRQGVESAEKRLADLQAKWLTGEGTRRSAPKELAFWDIPFQWGIMGVCWAVAAVMIVHVMRIRGKRFEWNAAEKKLTLPDGNTITPEQVEEFDRRKWHKFIMFVKLAAGHPALAGKEIGIDLYQFDKLEEWVVSMERVRFPDRFKEEPKPAGDAAPAAAEAPKP